MLKTTQFFISSIFLFASSVSFAQFINAPDSQVLSQIAAGNTDPLPDTLNVVVWNVKKGDYKPSWPSDFSKLAQGQHLMMIQEAMDNSMMSGVFQGVPGFGWMMARSFFYQTNQQGTGVATGSLQQPLETWFLRSPDLEPVVNTPKMVLVTTYQLASGASLMVINIHGINVNAPNAFFRQIDQIKAEIQKWNDKVLFAGDFNTWEPTRLKYLVDAMADVGLHQVKFSAARDLLPKPKNLDHMFLRGCKALRAQDLKSITSSDHTPLSAEITCAL